MSSLHQRLQKKFLHLSGVLGAAAIATLIALPATAQETHIAIHRELNAEALNPSDSGEVTPLDEVFLRMAFQSNNAEISTSQLALERSQSEAVRQYAQQMITEHTAANRLLAAYAEQRGLDLPEEEPLDPLSLAIAERLSQFSGREFDQAYMEAQANAHLRSLSLFQTQLGQGQDVGLRNYAAQLLPNIEGHYEMARQMTPNSYNADQLRPGVDGNPILR